MRPNTVVSFIHCMRERYHNEQIAALRPAKNRLDPFIPYHFLHEQERSLTGGVNEVNTVFLTSKECIFKCLMCDLWKNTLDEPMPEGAVIAQIDYALERLPAAQVIKLYNNGNFFDTKAVFPKDYPLIADKLAGFERVIVENHPKLCGDLCARFNEMLPGKLEVAMGLETIHPRVLPLLNKQMTTEDFKRAAFFLNKHEIDTRAFILLNPPYLTDRDENIHWTLKSVEFAFACGVKRCTIIPVRPGNGVMEVLWKSRDYVPPSLDMLEEVFDRALSFHQRQVMVDTWDIGFLSDCPDCFEKRKQRLEAMNLEQTIKPPVPCYGKH